MNAAQAVQELLTLQARVTVAANQTRGRMGKAEKQARFDSLHEAEAARDEFIESLGLDPAVGFADQSRLGLEATT